MFKFEWVFSTPQNQSKVKVFLLDQQVIYSVKSKHKNFHNKYIQNSNFKHQPRTLKFTYSEKATKIDKTFTVNLTICSNRQIDGEDFVNFCGLLRKHEL